MTTILALSNVSVKKNIHREKIPRKIRTRIGPGSAFLLPCHFFSMQGGLDDDDNPERGTRGGSKRSRKTYEEEKNRSNHNNDRSSTNEKREIMKKYDGKIRSESSITKLKSPIEYLLDKFEEDDILQSSSSSSSSSSGSSPVSSDDQSADLAIHCSEEKKIFLVHKRILSVHSPVFYRMFKGEFKEKNQSIMEMKRDDPVTANELELLLRYMYANGGFARKLFEFFGQLSVKSDDEGDALRRNPLMLHRDLLSILDGLLRIGDFYLVEGIKSMVENEVLSDPDFLGHATVYDPYSVVCLINEHDLRCNSRTHCSTSSSILNKLSPHSLIKHGTNDRFAAIQAVEKSVIDRTLEDLTRDPDLTRDVLGNFGLIQGLNGSDLERCVTKMEIILAEFPSYHERPPPKLVRELESILSTLTKMKKLTRPGITDVFGECWRDSSDLRDCVILRGNRNSGKE